MDDTAIMTVEVAGVGARVILLDLATGGKKVVCKWTIDDDLDDVLVLVTVFETAEFVRVVICVTSRTVDLAALAVVKDVSIDLLITMDDLVDLALREDDALGDVAVADVSIDVLITAVDFVDVAI